jgi:hypothetical protein
LAIEEFTAGFELNILLFLGEMDKALSDTFLALPIIL